jgi:two-component system NarL family response regulator
MIRVLAVDDHPLILEGIAALVRHTADLTLVGESTSGEDAVEAFVRSSPDVTVMDLRMKGFGGVEAIRRIRARSAGARVLAISTYDGDELIFQALEAGAGGFLLKDQLRANVCDAIRAIHRGESVVPPDVLAKLAGGRAGLTTRELDVLRLAARGLGNKEIAAVLDCAPATVKSHVERVLVKLGAGDRAEAVALAMKRGFLL